MFQDIFLCLIKYDKNRYDTRIYIKPTKYPCFVEEIDVYVMISRKALQFMKGNKFFNNN